MNLPIRILLSSVLLGALPVNSEPTTIDLAIENPTATLVGAYPSAGRPIATGDVNGDGWIDVIVSSCAAQPLGQRHGELTIIWGSASAFNGTISLSSSGMAHVYGPNDGDLAWCSVATGDFNGDDFDDILWGHPGAPLPAAIGRVYMIPGSDNFPPLIDLATPPSGVVVISGHTQSGFMGLGLGAGDINGDEIDDMVLSAPYLEHAEVYIIAGSGSLLPSYSTAGVVPGLTRIVDDSPFTQMGTDIASGDVDRDGMFDLVIGSPGASQSEDDGSVRIIHGMGDLPSLVPASDDALRPKVILAEFTNGQLGRAVAIGHVDYDGRLDIAVSAPGAPGAGCGACGVTYVLRDAGELPETVTLGSTALPITRLVGAGESTVYGNELTLADLDGDLRDDIVVGNYPLLGNQRARTVIAFAHALTSGSHALASDPAFTRIIEKEIGDLLGSSLATADLNKDGVDDLLIGAHGTAEAYVVNGTYAPTAVPPTASALLLRQNYPNPFNPQTSIPYSVPARSRVHIGVFDASGQLIAALVDSEQAAGEYVARWDGRDNSGREVASGVYFCKLVSGSSTTSIKLVLVR